MPPQSVWREIWFYDDFTVKIEIWECAALDKFVINGGRKLHGDVRISGAKNAAVAIIPAAILAEDICRIENVPNINDVTSIARILQEMGAAIRMVNKSTLEIDSRHINSPVASYDLVRHMRASYYLLGALLGRFSHAKVALPGGCNFGVRPIDQHLKGFMALGAEYKLEGGMVNVSADHLTGNNVYLDVVSVGATMNIMLAAVKADGMTVIENAAREPHIVDLANFLNSMGADVRGAGTDIIKIRGVKQMNPATSLFGIRGSGSRPVGAGPPTAGGDITVHDVIPKHLESITAKLEEMGVEITEYDEAIRVVREKPLAKCNIKTMPHPGFPTDMQPQIAAVLCLADGTSIINENVWDNRFRYVEELRRLGAQISVDGKIAVIEGVKELVGAPVKAMDLRAGAAMVVAGLAARGVTEIENIEYIERGYENIVEKLQGLGADIRRVYFPEASVAQAL